MAAAIKIGDVYTHLESGRKVVVTGKGKMLSDSHWIISITYTTLDNNKSWTRAAPSFNAKFAPSAA